MKLSVRKQVANGLVVFLLMPKAVATAEELFQAYSDGIRGFAADDDFDLLDGAKGTDSATVKVKKTSNLQEEDPTGGDPTGGDPSGYDPSAFDPSGYDPSGGDPSGCPPSTAAPVLIVNAPAQLVTAEDGSADLFEVLMQSDPPFPRTYHLQSTHPDEAQPQPSVIQLHDKACIPQSIWVIGQNDYVIDGDIDFEIEIVDEQDAVVGLVPGVNLDNDSFAGVAVDVLGPTSIPRGGTGFFLVRVANVSGRDLTKSTLHIEPTQQLAIKTYATALLSGGTFTEQGKLHESGALVFRKIGIAANDMLIVSVDAMLAEDSSADQTLTARFRSEETGGETDDDQDIRTAVP